MSAPLADLMRPQTIDEVVGQSHILNKDGILYRIAQSGRAANLIFCATSIASCFNSFSSSTASNTLSANVFVQQIRSGCATPQ